MARNTDGWQNGHTLHLQRGQCSTALVGLHHDRHASKSRSCGVEGLQAGAWVEESRRLGVPRDLVCLVPHAGFVSYGCMPHTDVPTSDAVAALDGFLPSVATR